MSSGLYVSLSGQIALERRLAAIAGNVANMNTAGFRADGVRFDTLVSSTGTEDVSFVHDGDSYISRKAGPMNPTGNPLDVAVQGDGWLALETPAGTVYTRDGRMHLSDAGELLSVDGYPVLDRGGSPILVDRGAGPVTIADDGMITQGGRQVGAIGLFLIPDGARLGRFENSGVIPDLPAEPVVDMTGNGIRQGYIEGANVNPVQEMTRLIAVTRAFESAAAAVSENEKTAEEAIRALGAG